MNESVIQASNTHAAGEKKDLQIVQLFFERIAIDFCRRERFCLKSEPAENPRSEPAPILLHSDKTRPAVLDAIRRFLGKPLQKSPIDDKQLDRCIDQAFESYRLHLADRLNPALRPEFTDAQLRAVDSESDLLQDQSSAPVIEMVNRILFAAVQQRSSDIHFQPQEDCLLVRIRLDGVLIDFERISKEIQEEVLARIKIAGKMDIAEKRLPQDGRATVYVGSRSIDLRIASMPASFGERIVVRLLDKSARLYSLPELGMDEHTLLRFRNSISVEHGLILVTGPTGSGKSTTLYAALKELDTTQRNAVTLEDPIEYQLDGISQTQINLKKGMTFASGLRSVLRQDPDIIMVGEIRDAETAAMAVQAALTGHLVFSTLHTNDAASAITRMLDLGIEPYLVASSLVSVLAQRLVRVLCPACKSPPDPAAPDAGWKANGCSKCRDLGYSGRLGIYELMIVDETMRGLITRSSHASLLRDHAIHHGMKLLADAGAEKVRAGLTSREEIYRVTLRASM